MSVLVPAWPPCRPIIQAVPFSTELVLDRSDGTWFSVLEHPYYVYPVHVSLSFLYSTTLASALCGLAADRTRDPHSLDCRLLPLN